MRVFIPSRARGTDTLVRREPRISAEIPSSDVQNWVRMSCARRKTACDVLEAARGRFVQTTENPAASPGISKLNPRRRSHSLFTNRRLRRGPASAQHAVPTPASTAPRARGRISLIFGSTHTAMLNFATRTTVLEGKPPIREATGHPLQTGS